MTRILITSLLAALAIMGLILIPIGGKAEDGSPDLSVKVLFPEEGGKYLSRRGLHIKAEVKNVGGAGYNGTIQVSAEVFDKNSGYRKYSDTQFLSLNLQPGEKTNVSFSNWTFAIPGNYTCRVTIYPEGDTNASNNVDVVNFDLWTDTWPYPIQLSGGFVSPVRGSTDTTFTFRVKYVYPIPPDNITIYVDGLPHPMVQEDPEDQQYTDGKYYIYQTQLEIGPHNYSFYASAGDKNATTPTTEGFPWVNLTLRDLRISPEKGYITTSYRFSVRYGSYFNEPPKTILLHIENRTYHLTPSNPDDENYASGNKDYFTEVKGWDVGPGPWSWWFEVENSRDRLKSKVMVSPGPSSAVGTIHGRVESDLGEEITSLQVTLLPLNKTWSFTSGSYLIEIYEGKNYTLMFHSPGYLPQTVGGIDLRGGEMKELDVTLQHMPRPAQVGGRVMSSAGMPIEGAKVNLYSEMKLLKSGTTDSEGRYVLSNVTPGENMRIHFSAPFHENLTLPLSLSEGEAIFVNVTLTELPPPFEVLNRTVPVKGPIRVVFSRVPMLSTLSVVVKNSTSDIPVSAISGENSTVLILPEDSFIYGERITLTLKKGLKDLFGGTILWRDFRVELQVEKQRSAGIKIKPTPGSEGLPVDVSFEISFGIHINITTLNVTLREVSGEVVPLGLMYAWGIDWKNSGATWGILKATPKRHLNYTTAYVLVIKGGLRDFQGEVLAQEDLISYYTTMAEPDRDGDGVPDSQDAFPDDPTAWKDSDGDGVPDSRDAFPNDPHYTKDTDGDGIPDERDADADGDGLPDAWERRYGLDTTVDDSSADPDGDGYTNYEEYVHGTDPTRASSNPGEKGKRVFESAFLAAIVALLAITVLFLVYRRGGREEMREGVEGGGGVLEIDEDLQEFLEE